jgi:cytochrome b
MLESSNIAANTATPQVVWDWPTRVVHWLLVSILPFSWWTAETRRMELHRYAGYLLLGILVFRLYWGIFGSSTARFSNFIRGPKAVLDYVRGTRSFNAAGHSPLGAISVVTLLAALLLQVGLGLFAVDVDGIESGPLSYLVSFDAGRRIADLHDLNFNVVLALIVIHIAAILFYYLVKRNNLVIPMITGKKLFHANYTLPQINTYSLLLRVGIGIAIATTLVWSLV